MAEFKKIAIFCGAYAGSGDKYAQAARALAVLLAAANIALVYGGGKVGIMGVLAETMLKHGGEVVGVIPQFLVDVELAHTGLTQLHIVNSMEERKTLLGELADGFIMLPGGVGSLDEFFAIMTRTQLGQYDKPCGILNVGGYFDYLLKFLDHATAMEFIKPAHRNIIISEDTPGKLLAKLAATCLSSAPSSSSYCRL